MKAKKLAKLILRGHFGMGLTPDQENGAKSSFLANLVVSKNISFPMKEIMDETSRARKLDMLLDVLKDSGLEISEDDIKKAHCAMPTVWARGVISVCLGFEKNTLTKIGLPAGYIAPLPVPAPNPEA